MVNFAKNVVLPFDSSGNSGPDKAPWVIAGGSYSGALVTWIEAVAPGTFWAYHASSAPVQAIQNFWEYFQPIQAGMPRNCSKDISLVINHVDGILLNGTIADKNSLKALFGLATVVYDDDFAQIVESPLYSWQSGMSAFLSFCDAIEGVKPGQNPLPDANGVGLTAALANYASYVKTKYGCTVPDCYSSRNPSSTTYTSTILDPKTGAGRQWQWMLCNEPFGWWPTGAPAGQTSLVSQAVTAEYWQQKCNLYFPGTQFSITEDAFNTKFEGWNVKSTRVMFSNGEFDPWRSASVSSAFRPGGPLVSTPEIPVFVIPGAVHVQDFYTSELTPAIIAVRIQEVAQIKTWVSQFYTRTTSSSSSSTVASSTTTSLSSKTTSTTATVTSASQTSSSSVSSSVSTSRSTTSSTSHTSSCTTKSFYSNSTSTATTSIPTSSSTTTLSATTTQKMTISTIYSTKVYTVTSCAATVTNCPKSVSFVTTEVIAISTTVCAISPSSSSLPTGHYTSSVSISGDVIQTTTSVSLPSSMSSVTTPVFVSTTMTSAALHNPTVTEIFQGTSGNKTTAATAAVSATKTGSPAAFTGAGSRVAVCFGLVITSSVMIVSILL
jgi:hypothetical protein